MPPEPNTAKPVERLEDAFAALIAALDANDADRIIDVAASMRATIAELETTRDWDLTDELKRRVHDLAELIETSRARVNKLMDLTTRRAEKLAEARGLADRLTYANPAEATSSGRA